MTTVRMPDGKKIRFPDNMSQQEIESVLQGIGEEGPRLGTGQTPPPQQLTQDEVPWQEDVKGFIRQVGSGATFGMTDKLADVTQEAEDYWRKKFDMLPSENTKTSKEYRDQFTEQHPLMSMGASVAGGILNPVARSVGNWMGAGKTLGSRVARASGGGAGLSATQAMGESDSPLAERLKQGTQAGLIGGAIGPVIPLAVTGGSKIVKGLADTATGWTSPHTQVSNAARQLSKALEMDKMTPKQALEKARKLGPEGAIADAGPATRALFYTQAARPSGGQKIALDWINERQVGSRDADNVLVSGNSMRVKDALEDMPFGTGYHDKTSFAEAQKIADDLYNKANQANNVINHPTINKLLRRPGMKRVMAQARVGMGMKGESVSQYSKDATEQFIEGGGKGKVGEGLKLKFLDQVKKTLWDLEEGAKHPRTGRATQKSDGYNTIRRQLTEALDEADTTGFYREARKVAGDKIGNERARASGLKFMREGIDAEELTATLDDMTPHELHNFRVGAVQALKGTVKDSGPTANATRQLMGKLNVEDRLQAIFGNKGVYKKYIDALENENELYKTFAKTQGSQTGGNEAALEEFSKPVSRILTGYGQLKSGSPVSWVAGGLNVLGGVKDNIMTSPGTSRELSKLLKGQDISQLEKHYIAQEMSKLGQGRLAERLLSGSTAGIGSLNAGR
jgi:hypothetical protein